MEEVVLRNVNKVYPNGFEAVRDFNLEIEKKEFVALTGPSGCGKSTILRMIAGMEDITSGEILVNGRCINDTAPEDRDIAMLFKNYALYPRMTVYDNIALGMKLRNAPEDEIREKVHETARLVHVERILNRKVKSLTAEQKHRTAIGRVILRRPGLILMEEPFMDLEEEQRMQIWTELTGLQEYLGATVIYVTNDPAEAAALGTRIVVMAEGAIQQVGDPQTLREHPNSLLVAGYMGAGFPS